MNIVVLDGYTLNPGDLSWDELKALGETTIYDRTPAHEIVSRSRDAEIIITNKVLFTESTFQALPKLKYIGVTATGYNIVDINAAREHGVVVTNVPSYGTASVAQTVFAHVLNLAHHVAEHADSVRNGQWSNSPDFCYWNFPLIELTDMTMGIIGFGRIGRATAKRANAFGMKVLAYDIFSQADVPSYVEMVELDRLVTDADIISLHCPLTADNKHMINASLLSRMKSTAFLINTGRGPLVDEQALANALNSGTIAGAGLDVLAVEPAQSGNPLITAKNCYITPHIAWATKSARIRLMNVVLENIRSFQTGSPQNVVNQ